MRMIFRVKSMAMMVSLRTPWRLGSALNDGRSTMVNSGTKSSSSGATGRISSWRMNSECQASSVNTRVLIRYFGSAPP